MGESKFTKTDMERVGLFQEMERVTIGDPFKSSLFAQEFNTAASKGKQMLPGGSKTRSAQQHGYFTDKYGRVFEGEGYSDPIRDRRLNRMKESQKNLGKPFLPSSGEKQMSGLGSHYGTLSGPISAFSPLGRGRGVYKSPGKNFYTNPGKNGTGYGYTGVTIGGGYKYTPDNYDRAKETMKKANDLHRQKLKAGSFKLNMHPKSYFDENPFRSDRPLGPPKKSHDSNKDVKPFKPSSPGKRPGGNKAGTFDPYPSHSNDQYKLLKGTRPIHVVNKSGKIFMPSAGPKSAPVNSVLDQNVVKAINRQNYNTINSVVF